MARRRRVTLAGCPPRKVSTIKPNVSFVECDVVGLFSAHKAAAPSLFPHKLLRTARAGKKGMLCSVAMPSSSFMISMVVGVLAFLYLCKVGEEVAESQRSVRAIVPGAVHGLISSN